MSTYYAGQLFFTRADAQQLPSRYHPLLQPARCIAAGKFVVKPLDGAPDDDEESAIEWYGLAFHGTNEFIDGTAQLLMLQCHHEVVVAPGTSAARLRRAQWNVVFNAMARELGVSISQHQRDLVLAGDPQIILDLTHLVCCTIQAMRDTRPAGVPNNEPYLVPDAVRHAPMPSAVPTTTWSKPSVPAAAVAPLPPPPPSHADANLELYKFLTPLMTSVTTQAMQLQFAINENTQREMEEHLARQRVIDALALIRDRLVATQREETRVRELVMQDFVASMELLSRQEAKDRKVAQALAIERYCDIPETPRVPPTPAHSEVSPPPTPPTPPRTPPFVRLTMPPTFRTYLLARSAHNVLASLKAQVGAVDHDDLHHQVADVHRRDKPSMKDFPVVPLKGVVTLLAAEIQRRRVLMGPPPARRQSSSEVTAAAEVPKKGGVLNVKQAAARRRLAAARDADRQRRAAVFVADMIRYSFLRRNKLIHDKHTIAAIPGFDDCPRCTPILDNLARRIASSGGELSTALKLKYAPVLCPSCAAKLQLPMDAAPAIIIATPRTVVRHQAARLLQAVLRSRRSQAFTQRKYWTFMRHILRRRTRVILVMRIQFWYRRSKRKPRLSDPSAAEARISSMCSRDGPLLEMLQRRLRCHADTPVDKYLQHMCYACREVIVPKLLQVATRRRMTAIALQQWWRWQKRRVVHPPPARCRCDALLEWADPRPRRVTMRQIAIIVPFVCRNHRCELRFFQLLNAVRPFWRAGRFLSDRYRWLQLKAHQLTNPFVRLHGSQAKRGLTTLTPGVCHTCLPHIENLFRRLTFAYHADTHPVTIVGADSAHAVSLPASLQLMTRDWLNRYLGSCCSPCVKALRFALQEWSLRLFAVRSIQKSFRLFLQRKQFRQRHLQEVRCDHGLCQWEATMHRFMGTPLSYTPTARHSMLCLATYIRLGQSSGRLRIAQERRADVRKLYFAWVTLEEKYSQEHAATTLSRWYRRRRRILLGYPRLAAKQAMEFRAAIARPTVTSVVTCLHGGPKRRDEQVVSFSRECSRADCEMARRLSVLGARGVSDFDRQRLLRRLCCPSCRVALASIHEALNRCISAGRFILDRLRWWRYWHITRPKNVDNTKGVCSKCQPWKSAMLTRLHYELVLVCGVDDIRVFDPPLSGMSADRFEDLFDEIESFRRARKRIALIERQKSSQHAGAQRFATYLVHACKRCKPSWVKTLKQHCSDVNDAVSSHDSALIAAWTATFVQNLTGISPARRPMPKRVGKAPPRRANDEPLSPPAAAAAPTVAAVPEPSEAPAPVEEQA